jgi:hypothetical protein
MPWLSSEEPQLPDREFEAASCATGGQRKARQQPQTRDLSDALNWRSQAKWPYIRKQP